MPVEFSVIVPSYNRAHVLPRALESIILQTLAPREIIVVDDGSSDNTARLLRESFPQIRYCYQRHRGVSAARNRGIRAARCPWIAFLDSDDEWVATKLFEQAKLIDSDTQVRLVHTNEQWIKNGKILKQQPKHKKFGGHIFSHCLPLCVISPSAVAIRHDVFCDIGVFDESLPACEDYDLWLRICARERVAFIDKTLVIKHGDQADQLSARVIGLDRYRIKALIKLLRHGALNRTQRRQLISTAREKIEIYMNGARKRAKSREVKDCLDLLAWLNHVGTS